MKGLAIHTVVNVLIVAVVLLVSSGEAVQTIVGLALMVAMRMAFRTPRGKKWWKTWYKVGYSFQLYLKGRLGK